MAPDPTPRHLTLPLPASRLGYIDETFEADDKFYYNVSASIDTWQCDTPGTIIDIAPPLGIFTVDSHHAAQLRTAEGEKWEKENGHIIVKSKTILDADPEKNDKSLSDTASVEGSDPDLEEEEAPEGGWGWMVVLGAFIISFNNGLVTMCFGILFTDFLLEEKASLTMTTALITTQTSIISLSFLVAGPFIDRFGWRTVVMFGAILSSAGLVISAFTPSVEVLFFSYSLLTGLGSGICTIVALSIPNFYFKRKRGKACALVLCGSNVGTIVGPSLVSLLQEEFGFRGATLITAGITLHACFSATVFHPVEWHTTRRDNTKVNEPTKPSNDQTSTSTLANYVRLLKSARVIVILAASAAVCSILRTGISLVPIALEATGNTQDDAAFVTSVIGICGFVSRMLLPALSDTEWFNKRLGYIACLVVVVISLIAFSLMGGMMWITIIMAVFGVGMSGCTSLGPLLMVHYMGLKNLVPTMALRGITSAVLLPATNPLYGVFETLTGDYTGPILFLCCQASLALVMWLIMPIAERFDKKRAPLRKESLCNTPPAG